MHMEEDTYIAFGRACVGHCSMQKKDTNTDTDTDTIS